MILIILGGVSFWGTPQGLLGLGTGDGGREEGGEPPTHTPAGPQALGGWLQPARSGNFC